MQPPPAAQAPARAAVGRSAPAAAGQAPAAAGPCSWISCGVPAGGCSSTSAPGG
jgi:hypothetical protein